jgi:hypothetical protein
VLIVTLPLSAILTGGAALAVGMLVRLATR